MNKLNYTNLYALFEKFNEHTDCYPGAMFVSLYNNIPICYTFAFNDKKLQYRQTIDKLPNKTITYSINDKVMLHGFMNNDKFEVIQYTSHEFVILGKDFPFLALTTLSEASEKSMSLFQNIFLPASFTAMDLEVLYDEISPYFEPVKREENIDFGIAAVDGVGSLYTTYYDFKQIEINVDENYNDDLPYDRMIDILNNDESAALMLFYGEPGTGKSSLIKKFIYEMPEKEFVFMDGTLLANVPQDRLMSYFLESQDTIFIFEDCEKILLNREHNYNPTMSILLNLTDGIISDVLNIKIICTFNTALSNIDKALLRKGRLTLKYEFKKLCKEKVQKILNDETVTQDMSLADIYHFKEENDFSKKQSTKIGF